jgi:dolichol-phosphate mannosyltransferase
LTFIFNAVQNIIVTKALVIIPTYNERENIEAIINKVFSLSQSFDILVIDDNSPDETADIVKGLQKEQENKGRLHLISRTGKLGLGTAYIEGFKYALDHEYEYVIEMDADFSHNPLDLPQLLETCSQENHDVAIGSRYVTGVNVVNWPLSRVLLSISASIYVRFITGMPIKDPTAGYICYKRKVLETINLDKVKFIGYAFQIELKYIAWKAGFSIKEIPIIFRDRVQGKSKMSSSIFKEAIFGVISMKLTNYRKMLRKMT